MSVPSRTFQMVAGDCLIVPPNQEFIVTPDGGQLRVESHAHREFKVGSYDPATNARAGLLINLNPRQAVIFKTGAIRNTGQCKTELLFADSTPHFLQEKYYLRGKQKGLPPLEQLQMSIQGLFIHDRGSHDALLEACESLRKASREHSDLIGHVWAHLQQKRYADAIRAIHKHRGELKKTI
ncbi:MAG: hypothetical protein AAF569_04555 [Pseudomonadota bacterium]